MVELCQTLDVAPFRVNEINFITEYCNVMCIGHFAG